MKRVLIAMIGVVVLVLAGGPASAQSPTMYTLGDIYYYLIEGTEAVEGGHPLEPPAGATRGDTRFKTLKEIYQDTKALFDRCDVLPSDVRGGKCFFSMEAGNWGVQTGTASWPGVLATGQTVSYSDYDDGYYQKGAAYDYTDNGDGTITDNFTGLIWPKDGQGPGCGNGGTLDWYQALSWAEDLTFAGYSDWRLPNARELFSLVVEDAALTPPYINQAYFPLTSSGDYWTSTVFAPGTTYVKKVQFDRAVFGAGYPASANSFVRAVRGGN